MDSKGQAQIKWPSSGRKTVQNPFEADFIRGVHQGVGRSTAVGASGAANAVNVVVRHSWHIEVDDHFCLRDVDSAGTDIGAHQHPNVALPKFGHGGQPRVLGLVRVDFRDLVGHDVGKGAVNPFGILFRSDKQQGP